MAAVDGGFVFARFRKERNGVVLLLMSEPRRPCAKMPSSVAVPAGRTKGGKD